MHKKSDKEHNLKVLLKEYKYKNDFYQFIQKNIDTVDGDNKKYLNKI